MAKVFKKEENKILKREVLLATEEAKKIIAEAQEKANTILSKAKKEAKEIKSKAYEEGKIEGLRKFEEKLLELLAENEREREQFERTLVLLAVKIAEKIIRTELETDRSKILPLVKETLESARVLSAKKLFIRVPPIYKEEVEQLVHSITTKDSKWEKVVVISDPSLPTGGCRIESENGIIDASIETQIKVLKRNLGLL